MTENNDKNLEKNIKEGLYDNKVGSLIVNLGVLFIIAVFFDFIITPIIFIFIYPYHWSNLGFFALGLNIFCIIYPFIIVAVFIYCCYIYSIKIVKKRVNNDNQNNVENTTFKDLPIEKSTNSKKE